jgi:acetyl-CoA carboxylase carboxyltransferase component
MHCVNPLTAIGLVAKAKEYKGQAIIQTAAASQLGRMIIRVCRDENIPLINVVRRPE